MLESDKEKNNDSVSLVAGTISLIVAIGSGIAAWAQCVSFGGLIGFFIGWIPGVIVGYCAFWMSLLVSLFIWGLRKFIGKFVVFAVICFLAVAILAEMLN